MTTRAAPRGLTGRLARDVDEAFPSLVEAYIDGIFSGIRRLTPTKADAEDLTQEAFIRAYRALSEYAPERIVELALRPWLWTIALNLCRSAARRRSRRVTEVAFAADFADAPSPDLTDADAVAAVMQQEWAERLRLLPEPQRAAVVLRHVVDLPYAEIAAITARPVGTVKADVHRGIERLRSSLAGAPGFDEEGAQS